MFYGRFSVNGPNINNLDYQKYIFGCLERILEFFDPVQFHVNSSSNALLANDLSIPHILEATFVNKKFVTDINYEFVKNYPNKLDKPNVSSNEDIKLTNN